MEMYTTSLEAAQKRVTNSLEKFALWLDRSNLLKDMYNAIAFATENIFGLGTAFAALILLTKGKDIGKLFSDGFSTIGVRMISFGDTLSRASESLSNGNFFKDILDNIKSTVESSYNSSLEELYSGRILKESGISEEEKQNRIGNQNAFLFNENGIELDVAQEALNKFSEGFTSDEIIELNDSIKQAKEKIDGYKKEIENIQNNINYDDEFSDEDYYSETQEYLEETISSLRKDITQNEQILEQKRLSAIDTIMSEERYTGIVDQLVSEHQLQYQQILESVIAENRNEDGTWDEVRVKQLATRQLLNTILSEQEVERLNKQMAARMKERSAMSNLITGVATMGATTLGTIGVGNFGQQMFGDQGQIWGSMIGGIISSTAMSGLAKNLTLLKQNGGILSSLSALFKTGSSAGIVEALGASSVMGAVTSLALPVIALITVGVMSLVGYVEKRKQDLIKKQAEEFNEESNKYNNMLGASVDVSKFDELSKGVDKLGKNVSLTDDEYKDFLDLNTKLAKQFPGLIKFTDGQGQAFVGVANGANSLSESIDTLIKQQQKLANEKLLAPELFNQTYKDAKKQYDKANEEYQNEFKNSNYSLEDYSVSNKSEMEWLWGKDDLYGWHNRDYVQYTGGNTEINEKILEVAKKRGANSVKLDTYKETDISGYQNEIVLGIKVDPKDEEILKQSIEEVIGSSKSQLVKLENNLEQARHILDSEVQAIFENLAYNDTAFEINPEFDVSKFNSLTDEAKNVLRTAISGMDLTAEDGASFKFQVSEILQELMGKLNEDDYNLIYKVGFEYDGTSSYKDFIKARQELYSMIKSLGLDKELEQKILISLNFSVEENGSFSDNFDYAKKIQDEGLMHNIEDTRSKTSTYDYLQTTYSVDELKELYTYLKEIDGTSAKISRTKIWDKLVVSKYALASSKELVNYFNQFKDVSDDIGKNRLKVINNEIKNLGKALGLSATESEKIVEALNRMPKMSAGGIYDDDVTLDDVENIYKDYKKIYDYVNSGDFNGKQWDSDILSIIGNNSKVSEFMAPLLTGANKETILKELKDVMTESDIATDQFWVTQLGKSEGGYKKLLETNEDLANEIEESLKIELDNFTSLKEAEVAIQAMANRDMDNIWTNFFNSLLEDYKDDLSNFKSIQDAKVRSLAAVMKLSGMYKGLDDTDIRLKAEAMAQGNQDLVDSGQISQAYADKALEESIKFYANQNPVAKKLLEESEKTLKELNDKYQEGLNDLAGFKSGVDFKSYKSGDKSGSGSSSTDDLMRDLDTLKKLDELIDKEYENWLKWNDAIKTTTDSLDQATSSALDTATAMGDFLKSDYYDKKGASLDALIAATEAEKTEWESLAKNGKYYNFEGEQITTKEFLETSMDYEKQLIELKKQRFNLDDEYYDDWLNTLKLQKDLIDGDEKRLGIYKDYNDYLAVDENYNKTKLANLQKQLEVAREALKTSDTQDEYLENLKRIRDLEDEITELIYQQKKDRVDLLESIGVSYATLIEAQKQLLAYTYTQEDQIANQNKLIDLLKQERDLRLEINESNRKILEQAAKYYEGNAYTRPDKYDETVNRRDELLKADAELLWSEYQKAIARAQNILRQERDENGNQRYTETEINIKAAEDEDARNLLDKYLQTIEERGNLIVERFEKRIAQIDNAISDLEYTKPQEWGKLEDISPYWDKYVALLQSKVAEIQEALKNTSGLTDAQINSLIDSYNEAVSALNEAARNKLEEITSYQQNQFSSLEDWIGEYIDNLGKLKDLVSDYYDNLLPDLEKEIDDRDKNTKLLELENNLLTAREKQRVDL